MDLNAALLLLGVGQGLFLALLLVARPATRSPGNLALAALVAALALSSLDDLLLEIGAYGHAAWAVGWSQPVLPWYGVLLRLHVNAQLAPGFALPRRYLVAPLVGTAAALAFLGFPPALRLALLGDGDIVADRSALAAAVLALLVLLISIGTLGQAIRAGLGAARAATGLDAATASRLPWLRFVLRLALICWLAYAAALVVGLSGSRATDLVNNWGSLVNLLALYALGVLALVRPGTTLPAPAAVAAAVLRSPAKYARSALDSNDVARLSAKLDAVMARQMLWRDPALSLPKLAQAVGASPNDVSQAINSAHGGNFYDYVNGFRIAAASAALADPGCTATILDICLDAGFNSKSVFNAAFKRATGETPSAYRVRRAS